MRVPKRHPPFLTERTERGSADRYGRDIVSPTRDDSTDRLTTFLYLSYFAGALHAIDELKCARVAVVDFDVHHGNGTEEIARHWIAKRRVTGEHPAWVARFILRLHPSRRRRHVVRDQLLPRHGRARRFGE